MMKGIKAFLSYTIMTVIICIVSQTKVMANTGTDAAVAMEAANVAYDASVITRMSNRAGAATSTGAKGIAFEVMLKDKKNVQNAIKKMFSGQSRYTRLTKSSTATQSDLVTVTKSGRIAERIQCKNVQSPSGIKDTLNKATTQYKSAKLVGTSETAEAYNEAAKAAGVSKKMADSGIKVKETTRIADKALANVSTKSVVSAAAKAGAVGAALSGGMAAVESIVNGDSFPDGFANVTVEAGKGGTAGAVAAVGGELATAGLTAAGVTGGAAVAVPVVAVVVVGGVTYYVLDSADQNFEIKEGVSLATDKAMTVAADSYIKAEGYVIENAPAVKQAIEDKAVRIADKGSEAVIEASEFWAALADAGIDKLDVAVNNKNNLDQCLFY